MKKYAIFIVGPTACSKSEIAVYLAERLNAEIVSADSMSIYRGMNIGTAKPSISIRKKVPHHLIDIVLPRENFSVYDYHQRAFHAVQTIVKKGKRPIIVGGTGLYIRALRNGLKIASGPNEMFRKKLEILSQEASVEHLYKKLCALDSEKAKSIKPRDKKRIIRSLEIIHNRNISRINYPICESITVLGLDIVMIGVTQERDCLYRDINKRVVQMVKKGLVEEAKKIFQSGISKTAAQAIGYKEIMRIGQFEKSSAEILELIKQKTRNYAKRQLTWFKKEPDVKWFNRNDYDNSDALKTDIYNYLQKVIS